MRRRLILSALIVLGVCASVVLRAANGVSAHAFPGWTAEQAQDDPPQAQNTWVPTGSMGYARRDHSATLLNNGLVLILGWSTQQAELFDPAAGTFSPAGETTYNHGPLATATLLRDGTVLIAGGWFAPNSAEIYDPVTGSFRATADLQAPHLAHTATLLPDDDVLIAAGGYFDAEHHVITSASAEIYHPATRSFELVGDMNVDRDGAVAALLPDGRVLIAGGTVSDKDRPGYGTCTNTAELYDSIGRRFTRTAGDMTAPRCSLGFGSAPLLANGTVLIVGGQSLDNQSADLFDPSVGTFSSTGSLLEPQAVPSVTKLPDGRVLVAGGYSATGPVVTNKAQIYDPPTGTFSYAANMNEGRQEHTATLLPDGRVLVTGGYAASSELSSAEIYRPTGLPDLAIYMFSVSPSTGSSFSACIRTTNQGTAPAGRFTAGFYWSSDTIYDPATDVRMASRDQGPLAAGQTMFGVQCEQVTVPAGTSPGTYYVLAVLDDTGVVTESNEDNNIGSRSVTAALPDLAVYLFSVGPWGPSFNACVRTTNQGTAGAGEFVVGFYWSTDTTYDPATDVRLASRDAGPLAAGETMFGPQCEQLTPPAGTSPGTYYVLAVLDDTRVVTESNEGNNIGSGAVTAAVDLQVRLEAIPSTVGSTFDVVDQTSNEGQLTAPASITRLFLSKDRTYDASDAELASRSVPSLGGGAVSRGTTTVTVPAGTGPGRYFVLAIADATGLVIESSEGNNRDWGTVYLGPDLIVSALSGPSTVSPGQIVTITVVTTNQGGGASGRSSTALFWRSGNTQTLLRETGVPPLEPGESSSVTMTVVVPNLQKGTYRFLAVADHQASVAETVEDNNSASVLVKVR